MVGGRFLLVYPLVFINQARKGFWAAVKGLCAAVIYLPIAIRERMDIQRQTKTDSAYIRRILWPELPPTHRRLRGIKEAVSRWMKR